MDTIAISDTELEEMFALTIPCRLCDNPAEMMSRGHSCRPPGWVTFLCEHCQLAWYIACQEVINEHGFITHERCGKACTSVEAFSDYRKM